MESSVGFMTVFAVSGSVVLVALQAHKRLFSDFMKKVELDLGTAAAAFLKIKTKSILILIKPHKMHSTNTWTLKYVYYNNLKFQIHTIYPLIQEFTLRLVMVGHPPWQR
ncbi:hypothetical protein MKW94_011292 [Papaver nudicaule]|uniref:Uncharacterized protein n=1 Tax=Papaver nudicaule TaxID=74823 RepID=A0AA41SQ48_PAPNU|nr:hypothetical protein [Papaver nudicaule]